MEKSLLFVVLGGKSGQIQVVPWHTNKMRVMFICPFKNMLRLYHSSAQDVKILSP